MLIFQDSGEMVAIKKFKDSEGICFIFKSFCLHDLKMWFFESVRFFESYKLKNNTTEWQIKVPYGDFFTVVFTARRILLFERFKQFFFFCENDFHENIFWEDNSS